MQVEYANLPVNDTPAQIDRFYTRELRIPFAFSVSACLRCHRWDVIQVSRYNTAAKRQHRRNMSITSVGRALAIEEELEDNLRNLDAAFSCLLVLELENVSPRQAFEAVLTGSDTIGAKVKERIEPNTTINMLLPIQKIRLTEEHTAKSIPSLSSKQFVVGKGILPAPELERFWYREEVLRNVKLAWREVGSRRTGDSSLRRLPLTDEMLSALKFSDLPLTVDVSQNEELCSQDDKDWWGVREGIYIDLSVSLKNLKCELHAYDYRRRT